MARFKVKLDHRGIEQIAKSSEMRRVIEDYTEQVADNVRDQNIRVGDRDGGRHEIDLPVETSMTTTDRARGSVLIPHAAGLAEQAKRGVLTKAASAAGLVVKGD